MEVIKFVCITICVTLCVVVVLRLPLRLLFLFRLNIIWKQGVHAVLQSDCELLGDDVMCNLFPL